MPNKRSAWFSVVLMLLLQLGQLQPANSEPFAAIDYVARVGSEGAADWRFQIHDALRLGADIDTQNAKGFTALMYSAYHGHAEVVTELLKLGASATLETATGFTALDLAVGEDVEALLEKATGATADAAGSVTKAEKEAADAGQKAREKDFVEADAAHDAAARKGKRKQAYVKTKVDGKDL